MRRAAPVAAVYAALECSAYWTHKRRLSELDRLQPNELSQATLADAVAHRAWLEKEIREDPDPAHNIEHSFYGRKVQEIPRRAVVAWACRLLAMDDTRMRLLRPGDSFDHGLGHFSADVVEQAEGIVRHLEARPREEMNGVCTSRVVFLSDSAMNDESLSQIAYVQRQLPLYSWYKPTFVQVCVRMCLLLQSAGLSWLGFQRAPVDPSTGIVKWTRHASVSLPGSCAGAVAATGPAPPPLPLFFLHGVGLGLFPFLPLIARLPTDRTVVAFELPIQSQLEGAALINANRPFPTAATLAEYFRSQVHELGADRCDVIGESFGTIVMSFVSRHHPQLMRYTVYIDPVNLYASFGQLIRFGADMDLEGVRRCWQASPYLSRFISSWFIRGDLFAQYVLKRAVTVVEFLEQGNLDRSDALFLVGGKDLAVNSDHTLWYLRVKCPNARVLFMPTWKHAGITRPWEAGPAIEAVVQFVQFGDFDRCLPSGQFIVDPTIPLPGRTFPIVADSRNSRSSTLEAAAPEAVSGAIH
jgi:pimeloyl-ACP methyl ester carboxylesterase